jgi:polysaccharide export outer membrane protein
MAAIVLTLTSCNTSKRIVYFSDVEPGQTEINVAEPTEIKIQPKDKLTIWVSCQDERLSTLFNLQISSHSGSVGTSGTNTLGYTVDAEGNIDFPVLGHIHIAGLSREEVAAYIKNELQSQNLLKDPVIIVEFQNLYVNTLGELGPGRYKIDKDHMTLLDVISQAGDLTIDGKRHNVMILRNENGKEKAYEVDLRSAESVYSSPAFYLQQNDLVYVEPNNKKTRQSTVNGTSVLTPSFWFSMISMTITLFLLFK